MNLVLNIGIGYLALGTLVLPLIIVCEMLLIRAKGVAFQDWLSRVLGESDGPPTIRSQFGALVRWPMYLFTFIYARTKGKTMMEFVAERQESKAKTVAQVKEFVQTILDGKTPIAREWVTFEPDDMPFIVHFYRSIYTEDAVPTHVVVDNDGVFTAWRAVDDDFQRNLPLASGNHLNKLKGVCEDDDEWLEVCHPHMTAEREKLWSEEMSRLQQEADLDRLAEELDEGKYDDVTMDDAYDSGTEIKLD